MCAHPKEIFVAPRFEKTVCLPAACENVIDLFCPSQVLVKGVFLANSIIKPINVFVTCSIINFKDYEIKIENLMDYSVFNINSWYDEIDNRFMLKS